MKKLFLYVLRFYDEVSKEDVTEEVVEYLGNITKSLYIIMKVILCMLVLFELSNSV